MNFCFVRNSLQAILSETYDACSHVCYFWGRLGPGSIY
jgi:hypothetical protein